MHTNVSNHRRFTALLKWGKLSVANALFKQRCKTSGGFDLLANTMNLLDLNH